MDLFKAIFSESSSEDDDDSASSENEDAAQDSIHIATDRSKNSVPRASGNTSGVEKKWQDLSAITNTPLPVGGTSSAQSYGNKMTLTKGTVHNEHERQHSSHENGGWSSNQADVGLLEVRGDEFVRGREYRHKSSTDHHSDNVHHHGSTGHHHGDYGSHYSSSMQRHGGQEHEARFSRLSKDNEDKGGGGRGSVGGESGGGIAQLSAPSQDPATSREGESLSGISGRCEKSSQQIGDSGNSAPPPNQPTSYGPALPKGINLAAGCYYVVCGCYTFIPV